MTTEQDILEQRLATAQYEQETAERARAFQYEIAQMQLKTAAIRLIQAEQDGHPLRTSYFPSDASDLDPERDRDTPGGLAYHLDNAHD